MKTKTIMMSVLCPYCGTGYTFRSQAKRAEFTPGSTTPLHPACRASARRTKMASTDRAVANAPHVSCDYCHSAISPSADCPQCNWL